jgi:fructose-1,6-bisphosphatase II
MLQDAWLYQASGWPTGMKHMTLLQNWDLDEDLRLYGGTSNTMAAATFNFTMDGVPMLFNGEHVGTGNGPACDIAVDPIDGTSLTAAGRQNAITMIAVADRGSMLDASSVFYMRKLVAGAEGHGVLDIRESIGDNIREFAKAKGKPVGEIVVAVLDRPRHEELIDDIRATGAGTRLMLDGDVAGGINAALYGTRIDMCVGIGGSPEGVATACAIKALGGFIQTVLEPSTEDERARGLAAGLKFDHVYEANDLVR